MLPSFPRTLNRDIRRLHPDDLAGVEAVVHLAELADPAGELAQVPIVTGEHHSAMLLAELAKTAGANRFIYLSCASVYARIDASHLLDERSPVDARTPYVTSKLLIERGLERMASSAFSPTVLRKATSYGSSPRMRFDTPLNHAMGSAATLGKVVLPRADSWLSFVHVLDLCEAIACILDAPRDAVHAQVFNVGQNRDNVEMGELARLVHDLHPACEVTFQATTDGQGCRLSFAKIREHVDEQLFWLY